MNILGLAYNKSARKDMSHHGLFKSFRTDTRALEYGKKKSMKSNFLIFNYNVCTYYNLCIL